MLSFSCPKRIIELQKATNSAQTNFGQMTQLSKNATRESYMKVVILQCVPTELRKWKALDMHAPRFTFKKELN
jgi:hypothetical protein